MGTRTRRKNLNEATKFVIVNMVERCVTQVNVARHFRISSSTVLMIAKKCNSRISNAIKKRGHKFKLNAAAI